MNILLIVKAALVLCSILIVSSGTMMTIFAEDWFELGLGLGLILVGVDVARRP